MALVFTVTRVDVNPLNRQVISTGFGANRQVYALPQIWPFPGPAPSPTVSPHPVAFNLQQNFGLTVTGTFPFNAAWRTTGSKYTVTGTGPGNIVLQSAPSPVPTAGNAVVAQRFTLQNPPAVIAPFKGAGDWTWTISHQPPTG